MATLTTVKPRNIDITGNYVVNNISASANVVAGNIKTDNLLYSNGSPYVFTTSASGQNTQIQFNDSGSFAGNANLTFNKTTGTLTVAYISGNGSALSSVTGANITGQVSNALVAGTVYTSAQPNITSVGTLTSLSVTGNISAGNIAGGNLVNANYISGNGSLLTSITGANVTGYVPNANIANTTYSVSGSNVSGQVGNALVAGTVYTNAQPNITSVGILSGLVVSGNIVPNANVTYSLGNSTNRFKDLYLSGTTITVGTQTISSDTGGISMTGTLTGDGGNLSNITGANVTGQVGNSLIAGTVYTASQPNITSIGTLTGLSVSGNTTITGNLTVSGTTVTVGSTNVSYVDSVIELHTQANLAPLTTDDGKDVGIQVHYYKSSDKHAFFGFSNDTQAFEYYVDGTETSGVFSGTYGNFKGATYISTVTTGTAPFAISSNTKVANLNADLLDGYDTATANTASTVAIRDTNGNLSANYFIGNGSQLTGLTSLSVANANYANYAGNVVNSNQPNITSIGTLASLTVTGNITSGNVSGGNLVSANYISGNGSLLTNITGANVSGFVPNANVSNTAYAVTGSNVSGQVGNSLVAGTVYTAAQPNITSVGTLTSLSVTGNITAGNVSGGNLVSANYISGNGSLLTSLAGGNVTGFVPNANVANTAYAVSGGNVSGQVSNALVAGTVYTASQPNITSIGTLSSLTVGGTVSVSAIGNLYIPGGTANYVIKTDGAGNLSWTAQSVAGNANISGSNTQIFFNDAGNTSLGASANLTFNKSTNTLTTTNLVVSGTTNLGAIGNLTITGGSSNNYLKTDGAGTLSWVSLPSTTLSVDTFTGNGVQTAFTLSVTPTSKNYTIAVVAGIVQPRSTYSVSGTTLTFSEAPPNTSSVEVTTINSGVSVASGGGGGGTGLTYQGISANTTLVAGNSYIVNTSSANLTLTLPASSILGDVIGVIDGTGTAATHAITITGANIMGSSSDMVVTTNRAAFQIVYYNATQGWLLTNV